MLGIYRAKVVNKNEWRKLSAKNEWVTGYLTYSKNTMTYSIGWNGFVPDYMNYFKYNELTFREGYNIEEVITDTICQLVETVNGQDYFENDIIQYKCESENIDGFSNPTEFVKAVILYDKEKYCWSFGYPNPQGEIEEIYPIYEMIDHIDGEIKVIGNIFDNADLLKGK